MTAREFNSQLTNLQTNLQFFANKLTGNNEDANDLMQDTYLKALNKPRQVPGRYQPESLDLYDNEKHIHQ